MSICSERRLRLYECDQISELFTFPPTSKDLTARMFIVIITVDKDYHF